MRIARIVERVERKGIAAGFPRDYLAQLPDRSLCQLLAILGGD
jgi:hypothetical protein